MGRIIGIDLGTTNTVIAIYNGSEYEIIAIPGNESSLLRSAVMREEINGQEEWIVGQRALDKKPVASNSCITSTKRFIGLEYDDETIKEDIRRLNSDVQHPRVVAPPMGESGVRFYFYSRDGKRLVSQSPVDIAALILHEAKNCAERALGEEVTDAVITVPAYFNIAQIEATKRAANMAGFTHHRIIEEPLAAALCKITPTSQTDENVLIYDFGGGTFDVTIAHVKNHIMTVMALKGDNHLGGDDIDKRLVEYFESQIRKMTGIEIFKNGNPAVKEAFFIGSRQVKIDLSKDSRSRLDNQVWSEHPSARELDLAFPSGISIDRTDFEVIIGDLIKRTINLLSGALSEASLAPAQIKQIILVGGSSFIPLIRTKLQEVFGPSAKIEVKDPTYAIAKGAAKFAYTLISATSKVVQIITSKTIYPLFLKTEAGHFEMLVPEGATYSPTDAKYIKWFGYNFYLPTSNPQAIAIEVYEGNDNSQTNALPTYYGSFIVIDLPAGLVRGEKVILEVTISGDRTLIGHLKVRSANHDFFIEPDKWKRDLIETINDVTHEIDNLPDSSDREHIELLLKRAIEKLDVMDSFQGRALMKEIEKEIAEARIALEQTGQDDFQQLLTAHFFGEAFHLYGEQWLSYIPLIIDEQLLTELYTERGRLASLQPLLAEAKRVARLGYADRYISLANEILRIVFQSSVIRILSIGQVVSSNPPHLKNHDHVTKLISEREWKEVSRAQERNVFGHEPKTQDECVEQMLMLIAHMRTNIVTNADLFYEQIRKLSNLTELYFDLVG